MSQLTENDLAIYSDCYKDAFGIRPRGNYPETVEEYEKDMELFCSMIDERNEEDRVISLNAQKRIEQAIDKVIDSGAGDRATALRWMFDHCRWDDGELNYQEFEHEFWDEGVAFDICRDIYWPEFKTAALAA